jgi:hypothetical protein
MGLIKKIFGNSRSGDIAPPSPEENQADGAADLAKPRRDLVRLSLRETIHQHGIPSDWIEVRSLSAMGDHQQSGMHVQFLVRKADQELLGYVHAFQEAFWHQILRVDPQARDWLFSVGWEFYGPSVSTRVADRASWQDTGGDTQPPDESPDELAGDLKALQALMSQPADLKDLPPAAPRAHPTK